MNTRAHHRRPGPRPPFLDRWARLGVGTLLALGLIATPALASPVGTWSSRADTVQQWMAQDPAVASAFFDPGVRYRTAGMPWIGNAVSIHTIDRFSIRAANLAPGKVVMYNPEAEPVTPRFEKRHPRWAMREFVRIAHANGLVAVLAPSKSLAGPDPRCIQFLDCGYLQIRADAFHLQAQKLECDLPVFTDFVRRAKAQAASPLVVQLTVGWDHPCVTPEAVRDAWRAALPYADGFSLWGSGVPALNAKGVEAMRLIANG
jgi:hypothetical protein